MASVDVRILDGPINRIDPETGVDLDSGAVIVFNGVVRRDEQGEQLDALEYTTYDPMAERVLRALAEEAVERFGVRRVDVRHSRGRVDVGKCSFQLRVAGAHRRETLDAMDWFIEEMKRTAPIWKRPVAAPRAAQTGAHGR